MKFTTSHQVVLPRPVEEVFRALALPEHLDRLLRLSPLVTSFSLGTTSPGPTPATQVVTFEFGERVAILPGGLRPVEMTMKVEQTIDSDAQRVDYRSRSTKGVAITVHKVRTFEPAGADGDSGQGSTRVREVVRGEAPPGLHLIARRAARKAHVDHMSRYAELFEQRPG